ncbi:MAG: endo-1,3-alpha-glucanase family glycosylhydrolase [Caldisericia bacterium]|nr:endo-1,3-alpha-glucanase family glycosylhydrolase [Caldisericia bacterium]
MKNKKILIKITISILIVIGFIFCVQIPIITTFSSINNSKPPSLANFNIPIYIDYYHLRIEYLTTSDWTTLELVNMVETILTMRFIEKIGIPTHIGLEYNMLSLNQPLEESIKEKMVGMKVDFAISSEKITQPLFFILKKGNLGKSIVRIFIITNEKIQIIKEITHIGEVPGSEGLNPISFEIDLKLLKNLSHTQIVINRPTKKMILSFYYPWYHEYDWSSPMLRDRPLKLYSSNDPKAILRQITQAQQAGIDGFISSWWGPKHYEDQNLEILLNLAHKKNFSISIYFETLTETGPRDEEEIYQMLKYIIDKYGDHPAFLKIDGKPVIVIWASQEVPLKTWENIFTKLRNEGRDAIYIGCGYNIDNLNVFDGIHEYGIFGFKDLNEVYKTVSSYTRYFSLLSDEPNKSKIWVATVQPGYDDRLIPGRIGYVKDRENGWCYWNTFEAAIESDPDLIFITTWNEWWEHTYIEPSELYGGIYLWITYVFASKWKGH